MKILIPMIMISATISAQQKEKLPIPQGSEKEKKIQLPDKELKFGDMQNKMYKMPCAKADESVYSSLKDKRKDSTDYKILML
ncbi:hypothetical protein [Chryseobacterium salviniae]|uniref:Uncharacterized protein n=1 Tax=Chryseobacterium salviniae TaxID=3101750 RepID=A0ABU6HTH1_9FLAO|nr:hypothetical protein [Chryseobacterium sp. T9W2-O]MEC3876316.1 hypothetical protein [Chryseobacterium sp. T9W2-O]